MNKKLNIIQKELEKLKHDKLTHTFNRAEECVWGVENATRHIKEYLNKNEYHHLSGWVESGGNVPKAYKYTRKATRVDFRFNKKGELLLEVSDTHIRNAEQNLVLTDEGKKLVIDRMLSK